jgi:DNA-binding beta-propeller fold protein YncE
MTAFSFAEAVATFGSCVRILTLCVGLIAMSAGPRARADPTPLVLEAKIPLGAVEGRIDHMGYDATRQYLYVAELGNGSVGVVDLRQRRVVRTIAGLREPQGIGYVRSSDTIYIASAGDGSVKVFQGADSKPLGTIALGEDADNVRVDDAAHRLFVGYGRGALAVIDTASQTKVADIPLHAHPESFQLEPGGQHIFVNVPDARELAVVDRASSKQVASWATDPLRANFPMALDGTAQRILAVFRHPPTLAAFSARDGRSVTTVKTCGDADDVFFDAKRSRIYVSCGEGFIDVIASQDDSLVSMGRIATAPGARTAFFAPDIDRLLLAVRASGTTPAAIWVFRPTS